MNLYQIRNELNSGRSIFDLPLRVIYYARVSTGTDEQTHSLKNQITYYTDFISNNPNWTFTGGYYDEALSGTSVLKRESFLQMIKDAKDKKFDYIITKEISRFSRNTLDSIKYTQELLSYGVGVLFQSDNINTLMPDAELRLTIMSSIAQDEVRKISERVKFGFKRAIENGVVLGNNKIWGYTKDNGKLVIVEEEAAIIRKIFNLYVFENMGIRAIVKHLSAEGIYNSRGNMFAFSTVRYILQNPKYMGYYCGNKTHKFDYKLNDRVVLDESEWVMYKDEENVPQIVSEELWNRANDIFKARSKKFSDGEKTSYQNKYAYSGKIVCAEHGCYYYRALYKYKSGDKELWNCRHFSAYGKKGCTSPNIYTTELNEIIKQVYEDVVLNKAEIIKELIDIYTSTTECSEAKGRIEKNKSQINELLKKKDKILDLSIKGRISDEEFEDRNKQFNSEIETLKVKISVIQEQEQKFKSASYSIDTLRGLIENEINMSNDDVDLSNIIESLIEKIEIHKTDKPKEIKVKVFIKLLKEEKSFVVARNKDTSVCSLPHI